MSIELQTNRSWRKPIGLSIDEKMKNDHLEKQWILMG